MAGIFCFYSVHNTNWIIDSGASDHMTYDHKLFESLTELPNGDKVAVTHKGNVKVLDEILLLDVLYVPGFKYNLISVLKLSFDLGCPIYFTYDACVVQGPSMSNPLVLGKLKRDLYYTTNSSPSAAHSAHSACH